MYTCIHVYMYVNFSESKLWVHVSLNYHIEVVIRNLALL